MQNFEKVIGYIYKITSPNNKIYVGQTINPKTRKEKYGAKDFKGQKILWNNCEKYNWNPKDTFEIIEECLCGEKKRILNEREIFWVKQLESFGPNGLNCSEGGKGHLGSHCSEETKEKIRQGNIGRKHTEESKLKIGKAGKGRISSDETKEKNRIAHLNKKHTEESKLKISEAGKGNKRRLNKFHSEETKKKISLALKGKKYKLKQ